MLTAVDSLLRSNPLHIVHLYPLPERIDGEFSVIDFKTSNRIYDEYYLQIAAYGYCMEDIYGEKIEAGYILRFDKESGRFEASKSTDMDIDFITFCGLLVGYTGLTKLKNRGIG